MMPINKLNVALDACCFVLSFVMRQMKEFFIILITICILGCKGGIENNTLQSLTGVIPADTPIVFRESLVPNDKIIHKGIFSPDMKQFFYTVSDKNFENFNVFVTRKLKDGWSVPHKAFFNSGFDEHGMSFSPDGNSIYFSSTRPIGMDSMPETWHIWKSDKVAGKWEEPSFVDIPNLKSKLVSHPIMTSSGLLYFHTSNLDYSQMDIFQSQNINGDFSDAVKTSISTTSDAGKCTPYVSPKEEYLIYASIGEQLDLMISFNDGSGNWINTRRLNDQINDIGQGNPYVTPDNKYLFYTTGEHHSQNWEVKWVDIEAVIANN